MPLTPDGLRALLDETAGQPATVFVRRFDDATRDMARMARIRLLMLAIEPRWLRRTINVIDDLERDAFDAAAAWIAPFLLPVGTWTPCPRPWTAGVPSEVPLPSGWPRPWSTTDLRDVAVLADYLERIDDPRGPILMDAPWAQAVGVDEYGLWALGRLPAGAIRMRWIRGGAFQRGHLASVSAMRPHTVRLTEGFWLAETPLIATHLGGRRPASVAGRDRQLAHDVNRSAADKVIEALQDYCPARLPTEAEWECACRAGSDADAPIPTRSVEQRRQALSWVKRGRPNANGLFHMTDGIGEWVADGFAVYPGDATDPLGTGEWHVYRGVGPPSERHIMAGDNAAMQGALPIGIRIAISA